MVDAETYDAPPHGWTCFHCGETFSPDEYRAARDHFGRSLTAEAACLIKAGDERNLVTALRKAEAALELYRNEDGVVLQQMRKLRAEQHLALQRAEEQGYARGLRDGQALNTTETKA